MIDPLRLVLFVSLSAVVVAASLHSWGARQVYGYFRFLAFECLVLLIVWNASRWFRDPLSIPQIASWSILALSTALAVYGVYLLRSVGRAERRVMEDTRTVVELGAYRYMRHPLYASLMFFGWGVFFKGMDLPSGVLVVAATALWVATARWEERYNVDRFGTAYAAYMRRTKMFIPFLL
jgi:protein-S-isoprenylcysteine O-methyltransferase Ste14